MIACAASLELNPAIPIGKAQEVVCMEDWKLSTQLNKH
jgi:hypothetical protein